MIIPVLDLFAGKPVLARGKSRSSYPPLHQCSSWVTPQMSLVNIAEQLLVLTASTVIYLADLDAIMNPCFQDPQKDHDLADLCQFCEEKSIEIWLDQGLPARDYVPEWAAKKCVKNLRMIQSTESFGHLFLQGQRPTSDAILSLDIKNSQLLGLDLPLSATHPVINELLGASTRVILLNLDQVGTATGPSHLSFAEEIRQQYPHLEIIYGGGIRTQADREECHRRGIDHVLVATSLH